jgi:GntR family transcriptional regulator
VPRPPAKAHEVAEALATAIHEGVFAAGGWLPPERELAVRYGVNRTTVRRAVGLLADRGLVIHHAAEGTQVRPAAQRRDVRDITATAGLWRGFHVSVSATGREPYTETEVDRIPAASEVATRLGIPAGTEVLRRSRRQGVRGVGHVQLSTTWVLPDISDAIPRLAELNTGPGGIHARIEELGYVLLFEDEVGARVSSSSERDRLELEEGQPVVLVVWRRCFERSGGRVVEVTHRVVVPSRQTLVYRYEG